MSRLRAGALLLVLMSVAPAHALVLCQQKRGQVVARDACRKKERPVDLAALAPLGPSGVPGIAGTAGAAGEHPLRMVDAADAEVGAIVFFFPSGAFVELNNPLLGRPVVFDVAPQGFVHNTAGAISNVFYQTNDCSGVPLIRQQSAAQVIAQVYGDSAYFSGEQPADRSYASAEYDPNGSPCGGGSTATGRGTCCGVVSDSGFLQPAVRIAVSALGLTPPFRTVPR